MGPRGFKKFTESPEGSCGRFYDEISLAELKGVRILIDAASLRGSAVKLRPDAFAVDPPAGLPAEVRDQIIVHLGSRDEYTSYALREMINRLKAAGAEITWVTERGIRLRKWATWPYSRSLDRDLEKSGEKENWCKLRLYQKISQVLPDIRGETNPQPFARLYRSTPFDGTTLKECMSFPPPNKDNVVTVLHDPRPLGDWCINRLQSQGAIADIRTTKYEADPLIARVLHTGFAAAEADEHGGREEQKASGDGQQQRFYDYVIADDADYMAYNVAYIPTYSINWVTMTAKVMRPGRFAQGMFQVGLSFLESLDGGLTEEDRRALDERDGVIGVFQSLVPDLCTMGGNDYYDVDNTYSETELTELQREGNEAWATRMKDMVITIPRGERNDIQLHTSSSIKHRAVYLCFQALTQGPGVTADNQLDVTRYAPLRGRAERQRASVIAREHYSLTSVQAVNGPLEGLGNRRVTRFAAELILPTNAQGRVVPVYFIAQQYAWMQHNVGEWVPAPNLLMLSRLKAELIFLEGLEIDFLHTDLVANVQALLRGYVVQEKGLRPGVFGLTMGAEVQLFFKETSRGLVNWRLHQPGQVDGIEEGCGNATQPTRIQWCAELLRPHLDEPGRRAARETFFARAVGHYGEAMRRGFVLREKVQELLDTCRLYRDAQGNARPLVTVEHAMVLIVALRTHAVSLGSEAGGLKKAHKAEKAPPVLRALIRAVARCLLADKATRYSDLEDGMWYSEAATGAKLALRLMLLVQHQHYCEVLSLVNGLWLQMEGGAVAKRHVAEAHPYSVPTLNLCQRLLPDSDQADPSELGEAEAKLYKVVTWFLKPELENIFYPA